MKMILKHTIYWKVEKINYSMYNICTIDQQHTQLDDQSDCHLSLLLEFMVKDWGLF